MVMEEAAQILEVETIIPLLLQNPEDGHNRLKRWIMIGDLHKLPPVVQNQAFQKYSYGAVVLRQACKAQCAECRAGETRTC